MTSNRFSKVTTLALICALALSAAAPAAAVSVANEQVPGEAEVGETVEATFTLDNLYKEPNFQQWALQGQTELTNVTWTVAYKNPSGATFDQQQYSGQSFSQQGIDAESETAPFDEPVTEVQVTVRGDVPAVEEFTYSERESFVVAKLDQKAGDTGSTNNIDTWSTHQYTTGEEGSAGSQQARNAIQSAESAIADAKEAGADASQANESLQTAIDFYELGQFEKAVSNAQTAQEQAEEAQQQAENSQQTTRLLMYAGIAAVVLALLGGGYWYYQQQQDDYDKLG